MSISKVSLNFAQKAVKEGKQFTHIPLKNNESANILFNKNSVDCFIVSNNKIVSGRGATGPKEHVGKELAKILDKLSGFVESADEFKNTTMKNLINNFAK